KTDDEFRKEMFEAIKRDGRCGDVSREAWDGFARRLFYRTCDLSQSAAYPDLGRALKDIEKAAAVEGQRLFYMATMPELFVPVVESLSAAGMIPAPGGRAGLRMGF